MEVLDLVFTIFTMLGGLAVFMFGMKVMGDNLERAAGDRMKKLFARVSNNRFKGVGIGIAVTAIIQSSSATTVMLVGFVNVGLMTLPQAAAIIMGSNIGTTVTAQLASLQAFNITAIMSAIAAVAYFVMLFTKKKNVERVSLIFVGLGMLFIGLSLMSSSMKTLAVNPDGTPSSFANFMLEGFTNPILAVLAGLVFTAIIQSSSAATGILLSLAAAGVVKFETGMFMILGMNIGTCVTALLACIGTSTNAKRTAVMHLMIKTIGVIVFFVPLLIFKDQIAAFFMQTGGTASENEVLQRAIANFHTSFNVLVTALILPFVNHIVAFSKLIVRDKDDGEGNNAHKLVYLDDRILQTPPIAVSQVMKEVRHMGDLAGENLMLALEALVTGDITMEKNFREREQLLNFLNREIPRYLVQISALDISVADSKVIGSLYHVVNDMERIGDYAEDMFDFACKMSEESIQFSKEAIEDIADAKERLNLLMRDAFYVFSNRSVEMIREVDRREQEIDDIKDRMGEAHIQRLNEGRCTAESGSIYLSLSSQIERVADHLTNVAYSIRDHKDSPKTTHHSTAEWQGETL